MSTNGLENGAAPTAAPPPAQIKDLADACVKFVERAAKVTLDYEPETLGVLDHWLRETRTEAVGKREVAAFAAQAAGAYFGELVRRRYPSWWRADSDDPALWRIEFEEVYLAFHPVLLMADAIGLTGEHGGDEGLELEEDDREAVAARLAELPAASLSEFYAPTTRLEVIEVALEAIRSRRIAADIPVADALTPADYDD
ncbi:MAG TPA: hypothetical protein VGM56_14285 [Byssovorax sp.]